MPRSVRDVVNDFEKRSSPPKAPIFKPTPPRRKSTHSGPSIAHPLLQQSVSPRVTPRTTKTLPENPTVASPPDPKPASPMPSTPETNPLTTPQRLDTTISLSRSPYSDSSLTLSNSSTSTKLDNVPNQTPPQSARPPNFTRPSSSDYFAINIPDAVYPPPTLSALDSLQPVEGEQLFSRDAPALSLPALDDYLAKIPAPQFSAIPAPLPPTNTSGKPPATPPSALMFPPLQELSKGMSLDDLMHNKSLVPSWKNRNSIFGFLTTAVVGVAGSSIVSSLYSLAGVWDTVQIFALLLSSIIPNAGVNVKQTWKKVFLGVIPNILALNIFPLLTQKLLFFSILVLFTLAILYYFHRTSQHFLYDDHDTEGLYRGRKPNSEWGILISSFVLIILYLPVSTIAVHGLVWSSDFWPTQNLSDPGAIPTIPVCYTTASTHGAANLAPVVVILCLIAVAFITIYFPIRLNTTIKACLPIVDQYTELGKLRSSVELAHEYERQLDRDHRPLNYLYDDYRRTWGTYRIMTLFAKLSALLIVALCDPDNCLFHSTKISSKAVMLIRQLVLIIVMAVFVVRQTMYGPFIDPVSNASEWVSRFSYLLTSMIGLGNVFGGKAQSILEGPILYIVYVLTYGLNIYFAVIHWSWVQRLVKRLTQRIDFSIDIFSPHLDISPDSPHVRRRIWQETLSTLFLTNPETRIPAKQEIYYDEAANGEWPPYLLNFQGSVGERHAENVKILREVGGESYHRASAQSKDEDLAKTFNTIIEDLVGPDAYWGGLEQERPLTSRWGNLWTIPFPPTVVIRFDDGAEAYLSTIEELTSLVQQNWEKDTEFVRNIRRSLRALENQRVYWPYTHVESAGGNHLCHCFGSNYEALATTSLEFATLIIKRNGRLIFPSSTYDLASGFDLHLQYNSKISADAGEIGLTVEGFLTPRLASFLALNERTVRMFLPRLMSDIHRYRRRLWLEAMTKRLTLSYNILEYLYERPMSPEQCLELVSKREEDVSGKVVKMFYTASRQGVMSLANERMMRVTESDVTVWWYLFWDDFWRRNHVTVSALQSHATDFDPHYPTSIAYRPLPRAALDAFLVQRGLLQVSAGGLFHRSGILYSGILNHMYLRLNDIVFGNNPSKAIGTHRGIANGSAPTDSNTGHIRFSSLGTGGGTDHDDASIRPRPHFRFEEIISHPHPFWTRVAVWFGITPFSTSRRQPGTTFDLKLDDHHHYIRA